MDFIRFLAFSLICGFLILGCGKQQTSTNGQSEPKRVTTVTAEALTVENRERVPGNVHPATNSTIEAKLSGRIVKFLAKEGDKVREGDVLVELDGHEIRARLDQALASEKQATLDLARFKKLLPAGAVTQQEYDAAEARAKVAAASVAEARAFVGYVKIVAPYDGIITKTIFEEGDLASPGKPLLTMEKQDLYRFEADVPETLA
ncbi:MAG: efflux RND transporter periplasmic adaptor subunit, partial [Bdellovibrionales bacterium]|nr:efflux RND transporter periplasmic adaptor subunit [Bdellovibrionales bacterium]